MQQYLLFIDLKREFKVLLEYSLKNMFYKKQSFRMRFELLFIAMGEIRIYFGAGYGPILTPDCTCLRKYLSPM